MAIRQSRQVSSAEEEEIKLEWWEIVLSIILVAVGGGGIFSLIIKSRLDELHSVEERLSTERRRVYADILAPYVKLFAGITRRDYDADKIGRQITSDEYRKAIFELGLVGSDKVVCAYNDLMQYYFKLGSSVQQDIYESARLWGKLRLEIRKSLGNKNTKLTEFDMLRGEITDIDKLESRKT